MKNNLLKKIENIPVPLLPTMVGAATLSNVYSTLGYTWVRHLTMWLATIILIAYLVKITVFTNTCKKEYSNTVPASLYAGFTMITMILGSYYFDYNNVLGKSLWSIGLILHTIHLLIFIYRNVIKGFNKDTFVPSWFVTFNGIMVSVVVGSAMNEPLISKIVLYYGILALVIIMPFMVVRLIKHPLKDAFYHTQAILLAPSSLCVVSYLNVVENRLNVTYERIKKSKGLENMYLEDAEDDRFREAVDIVGQIVNGQDVQVDENIADIVILLLAESDEEKAMSLSELLAIKKQKYQEENKNILMEI